MFSIRSLASGVRPSHLAGVAALCAASWPAVASADLTGVTAYPSKRVNGIEQPYTPAIGETYRIAVKYEGNASQSFKIRFTMAGQERIVASGPVGAGTHYAAAEFGSPLDGVIPFRVVLDSDGALPASPLKTLNGSFTPIPPTSGIDYYEPRAVTGGQMLSFDSAASGSNRLAMMMGQPSSDAWQTVKSASAKVTTSFGTDLLTAKPVENTGAYHVYFWDKPNVPNGPVHLYQQFRLDVSNQRVNADKLRTTTWGQLDSYKSFNIWNHYLAPETVIESNDPKIAAFVTQVLGSDYRTKMTPYDAARKLFQAVLARVTYTYPANGSPDLRGQTAVAVLDTGLGDCGGFSMLLVALYRHIGIASRTSCGVWLGFDAGHCWTEFWLPGFGWIVADGSLGNQLSEDGSYAYYFGNIPNLNARAAVMRGNTFNIGDQKWSWLQSPQFSSQGASLSAFAGATWLRDQVTPPANSPSGYVREDSINAVVFRNASNHIREIALGSGGWATGDLSTITGAPAAASAPSPYVRADAISTVVYRSADSHVRELALTGKGWIQNDLTAVTGAPAAAGGPAGYRRSDNTSAVVYRSADNHIRELSLTAGVWSHSDLSVFAGSAPAEGDPVGYVRGDHVSTVLYRGNDGHIREVARVGSNWVVSDLNLLAGAVAAAGDPTAYVRTDGSTAVLYRSTNHHIYELALTGSGWAASDLTALTNAPSADSDPAGYARGDAVDTVVYRSTDNHIRELAKTTSGWEVNDLSAITGAPAATGKPSAYLRSDGYNSIVYLGANGHVRELYLSSAGGGWKAGDLGL